MNSTGVILAGGSSRRMGRDKLQLKIGDVPLLERVCNALASCCEELIVVGGEGNTPARARRISDLRYPGEGPLAGIEAGLWSARHRSVFVAAGDMPFLARELVEYLLGLLSDDVLAAVPSLRGRRHPLCAAYGRELRSTVSAVLDQGVRSVREMLGELPGVRYVGEGELRWFGEPNLLLMNVNSPADLEQAETTVRNAFFRREE
ncbi:MAG: molybdenum cofactor guanylyltransferase [Actinomycetota bacterium]|nr:molybdenum cofactor guanylyltransferase [Actinomycetota bacterium]